MASPTPAVRPTRNGFSTPPRANITGTLGTKAITVAEARTVFSESICEAAESRVVGYGLDWHNRYRTLPYIGVLKPSVYGKK